ncbi:MAG: AEC family transporter [Pseudohongiellaceae bacterium]
MLLDILAVIAPTLLCALVGFGWVRRGLHFDTNFVSSLVLNIGAPCLLFSTFMAIEIDAHAFGEMAVATVLAMLGFAVVALPLLRLAGLELRSFLFSQMFPNVGNMGLPLCLLAFGEQGLVLALTYFMISTLCAFTLGSALVSGQFTASSVLGNPILYAVCVTLLVLGLDLPVPKFILDTTTLLGDLTIPLMLIALGVSLGRIKVHNLRSSALLSLLRLLTGFAVSLGVSTLLGLEGATRGVLIVQSSMPVAVFAYLFAVRHERNPEEIAGAVVISTVLSFLTLPLLLWFVLPNA